MQTIAERYWSYKRNMPENQKARYLPIERKVITDIYNAVKEKYGTELALTVSIQLQMYKDFTTREQYDIAEYEKTRAIKNQISDLLEEIK